MDATKAESAGGGGGSDGAGDGDAALLQGLAHHLQALAVELWQLVEEEDAVVG